MTPNPEMEVVLYAKVGDFTGLAQASKIEEHEQLEARLLDGQNKIRVRKTTAHGTDTPVYEFTAKRKNPDNSDAMQDSMEYTSVVTEDFFKTFETAVMEQKLVKTRYYFPNNSITLTIGKTAQLLTIPNVGFEVDVFKPKGEPCEWVKIDVEVDPILAYLKEKFPEITGGVKLVIKTPKLPFKPLDIIYKPTADEAQKAFIAELWQNQFTIRKEAAPAKVVEAKTEGNTPAAAAAEVEPPAAT